MLPALLDEQRRSLQRLSFVLCAFAIGTLTIVAPASSSASAREHRTLRTAVSSQLEQLDYPAIHLRRDPFVPAVADRPIVRGSMDAPASGTTVVRAVVTGAEPRALIESNGSVRVIRIGDRIGSLAVIGIDATGVVMDGGVTLQLDRVRP